jgi:uncharacterized protein
MTSPLPLPSADGDELDRFLTSDAMPKAGLRPTGLDGLLAALVLCPDAVKHGGWLPWLWDADEGAARPAFADEAQETRLAGLILEREAAVRDAIAAGEYLPRLAEADREPSAHAWAEGFVLGMTLNPQRWDRILTRHGDLVSPMVLLGTARGRETLAENGTSAAVIDGIPAAVAALRAHFEVHTGVPVRRTEAKVGRNDPCPCGSGKKFKKCCGSGG